MKFKEETILSIEKITKTTRITVITQEGTILANGILTSTVCANHTDVHGDDIASLEKWKRDHQWLIQ